MLSLVQNIQRLCKENQTSIPKLEKEFGWGHGAVYRWDVNCPSADKLQKVADYFGVTTDHLLGKESSPPPTRCECINVPLDPETVAILCKIPLLSKNNKAIILDMIQSMLKNRE